MPSVITPCGGGGGGIQFDVDPQTGDWLYVETTGSDPGTGRGILFKTSAAAVGGIRLLNTAPGNFDIENTGTGRINITSDTKRIFVFSGDGIEMVGDGSLGIQLEASGDGDIVIEHTGTAAGIELTTADGNITLSIVGGFLRIFGLPIVNPGGTSRVWSDGGVLTIT